MAVRSARAIRLSREQRREQLLDAGAELVSELGPDALTMEGVAQRAAVSKALPYRHFADAQDLLVALAVREAAVIAERTRVMRPGDRLEDGVRASLKAYFDVVQERGTLLAVLFQYRFSPGRRQEVQEIWSGLADFFALRFSEELVLPTRLARAAAFTVLTTVVGGQQVWTSGLATRPEVEELLLHMIVDGLTGFTEASAGGRG